MKTPLIMSFTLHNNRNLSILDSDLLKWRSFYPNDKSVIFGPIIRYSWIVDGKSYGLLNSNHFSVKLLPDFSGFICFESSRYKNNNSILLDAYGKERLRLSVPWELTGRDIPKGAEMWFRNVGEHYENPETGEMGKFGVTAYIEYAGDYYFELDYHTGKFLWGKEIRF